MESRAYPLNLTLKEEQKEDEVEIQELEDGPVEMQKVQICSEGTWVSKVWGSSLRAGLALGLPPRADMGSKNSPVSCVCIPEKTALWFQKANSGGGGEGTRLQGSLRN